MSQRKVSLEDMKAACDYWENACSEWEHSEESYWHKYDYAELVECWERAESLYLKAKARCDAGHATEI